MIRDKRQRAQLCLAVLATMRNAQEYFTEDGPTPLTYQRACLTVLSGGEQILLDTAMTIWAGAGYYKPAPRLDALWQLDERSYRRVLAVLAQMHRPADEIDEFLARLPPSLQQRQGEIDVALGKEREA